MNVAVLRETVNGDSFLVSVDSHDDLDAPRLEEAGYEISGWLKHPEQYQSDDGLTPEEEFGAYSHDDDEVYTGPLFTNCAKRVRPGVGDKSLCNRMIVIID